MDQACGQAAAVVRAGARLDGEHVLRGHPVLGGPPGEGGRRPPLLPGRRRGGASAPASASACARERRAAAELGREAVGLGERCVDGAEGRDELGTAGRRDQTGRAPQPAWVRHTAVGRGSPRGLVLVFGGRERARCRSGASGSLRARACRGQAAAAPPPLPRRRRWGLRGTPAAGTGPPRSPPCGLTTSI